ncbi:MAG: phosphatase domain-containing protein [Bacteroidales bacterium]
MVKKTILFFLRKAINPFKAVRIAVKKRLGMLGDPVILPYNAYGTENKVMITGAVIEDKGLARPEPGQNMWKNILTMVKRYSGDEIAGVRVEINYCGQDIIVRTNERGLFHTILPRKPLPDGTISDTVSFTLIDRLDEGVEPVRAESTAFIVSSEPDYIVVSDIDDTVLVSHSTKTLKKLRVMMSKNALTRSPFEGVAAFYRALNKPEEGEKRPVFYVSASEWNLYDLLVDFFKDKMMPAGPLLLSDVRLSLFSIFRSGKKFNDKVERIKDLFEHYYLHNFILIGDSGQEDPDIYLKMTEMYPGRVKVIYIRYIGKKRHNRKLERQAEEARELGTEMIVVKTSTEAARHAAGKGLIDASQIEDVMDEKNLEESIEEDEEKTV